MPAVDFTARHTPSRRSTKRCNLPPGVHRSMPWQCFM